MIIKKQIEDKESEIKELEKKANKAKQGVNKRYNYRGDMVPAGASGLMLVRTKNSEIFDKLAELEKTNDRKSYEEILRISSTNIEESPEWFTLYLFKGEALFKLGRKDEAIKEFQYVLDNAPDDSDFFKMAERAIESFK